ncbi:MAG: ATP-dependent Clp protease ATP-binding subunit, partial [Clostridia bacterium]|nr:ATP-dependent Clp protease ATP-binding subunit [Clostridia bacterium]
MNYNFKGFTEKSNIALNYAFDCAQNMGHTFVGSEHLLLGLLMTDSSVAQSILNENGIDADDVRNKIIEIHGQGMKCTVNPNDLTARSKYTLQKAKSIASRMGSYVGTEHILCALIDDSESYAVRLIQELDGDIPDIIDALEAFWGGGENDDEEENMGGQSPMGGLFGMLGGMGGQNPFAAQGGGKHGKGGKNLDKYGRDLTAEAKQGKIDPVIGRQQEIDRVIQILSRRTKNNPCLIGEPGVGKT